VAIYQGKQIPRKNIYIKFGIEISSEALKRGIGSR
jgi:hypothetical protein